MTNPNNYREVLASKYGLNTKDVRCYHCQKWGYNCGKCMNSLGESRCTSRQSGMTASFQWCKHFEYVGKGE